MNSFYRLKALYEEYRDRTEASVKAFEALADAKNEPGELFSVYNKRIEAQMRAAHDAFGLVGAFFSTFTVRDRGSLYLVGSQLCAQFKARYEGRSPAP